MKMSQRCRKGGALTALLLSTSCAHAIDVVPEAVTAPPPNLNSVMLTYNDASLGEQYSRGRVINSDSEINSSRLFVRYTRSFELLQQPAAFYIQPSFVKGESKGLAVNNRASGTGDTALALAYWPWEDRETGDYLAVAGTLIVPTGEYDRSQSFNTGSGRYGLNAQIGYQTPLSAQWGVMAVADVQVWSDIDDVALYRQKYEQDPLYSSQLSLIYTPSPAWRLSGSLFRHQGGEGTRNGQALNDKIKKDRYQLVSSYTMDGAKAILQYGQDLETENGPFQDRQLLFRYIQFWK